MCQTTVRQLSSRPGTPAIRPLQAEVTQVGCATRSARSRRAPGRGWRRRRLGRGGEQDLGQVVRLARGSRAGTGSPERSPFGGRRPHACIPESMPVRPAWSGASLPNCRPDPGSIDRHPGHSPLSGVGHGMTQTWRWRPLAPERHRGRSGRASRAVANTGPCAVGVEQRRVRRRCCPRTAPSLVTARRPARVSPAAGPVDLEIRSVEVLHRPGHLRAPAERRGDRGP